MISVVYTLGKGSLFKDFEIRMSIRSVEKNVSGIKDIWVVGHCPEWLKVNHIPATDPYEIPDRNIVSKILKACDNPDITEDFLFLNDDHFILSPYEAATMPYYWSEEIPAYLKKRGLSDNYGKRVKNVYDHLVSKGLPTKYFDIHTPIIYNKTKFKEIMNGVDWNKPNAYLIKSLYANSLSIEGEQRFDNKTANPPVRNVGIFSTLPHIKASVQRYLTERFPKPSKYEI